METPSIRSGGVGQAFDGMGFGHVGNQRDPGLGGGIHAHDPSPLISIKP